MTSEARVLLLYHTAGCHLCEQAEALAAPLTVERGWVFDAQMVLDLLAG